MAQPGRKLPPTWVLTMAAEIAKDERRTREECAERLERVARRMQELAPELEAWRAFRPSANTLRAWAQAGRELRHVMSQDLDELFQRAVAAA